MATIYVSIMGKVGMRKVGDELLVRVENLRPDRHADLDGLAERPRTLQPGRGKVLILSVEGPAGLIDAKDDAGVCGNVCGHSASGPASKRLRAGSYLGPQLS